MRRCQTASARNSRFAHLDGPGGLPVVALFAGSKQVALARVAAGCDRHDVVDVEHDTRRVARPAAVPTAEAVTLKDPEAEPGREGIAGARDTSPYPGASRT